MRKEQITEIIDTLLSYEITKETAVDKITYALDRAINNNKDIFRKMLDDKEKGKK